MLDGLLEFVGKNLAEYGVMGLMLVYFLWKNSKTFELYRTTMREEQGKLKCDVDAIKEILGKH